MKQTFLKEYYNQTSQGFDQLDQVREWERKKWIFHEDDKFNVLGYNVSERKIMLISYNIKTDEYSLPIYIKFDFLNEEQVLNFEEMAKIVDKI